jgi:hypothetical protein
VVALHFARMALLLSVLLYGLVLAIGGAGILGGELALLLGWVAAAVIAVSAAACVVGQLVTYFAGVNLPDLSTRSKALYWIFGVLMAVSVAFMLAVMISLGGYYLAGWEGAPVSEMGGQFVAWVLFAIVPLLALRLAVMWSVKKDQREQ